MEENFDHNQDETNRYSKITYKFGLLKDRLVQFYRFY